MCDRCSGRQNGSTVNFCLVKVPVVITKLSDETSFNQGGQIHTIILVNLTKHEKIDYIHWYCAYIDPII